MSFFNPKFATLVAVLMLSGCGTSEKQTTAEKPPEVSLSPSPNPITDSPKASVPLGKAKASCGDALPKDAKAYPVSFYPVFVSYSDKNLELVKKHFCADAIKRRSEKLGQDVVQVGSFTSRERANALKSELSAHLQGADIGEPTVVQSSAGSTKNVGEAAKLSSKQIKELKDTVGIEKDFETQSVVVLPTDIPSGFTVSFFRASRMEPKSVRLTKYSGGVYSIGYKSSDGVCFTINGGVDAPIGDEPIAYKKVEEIISPALGKLEMGIDRINDASNESFILLVPNIGIKRGKNRYYFGSFGKDGCKRISEKDAIRVLRSLQFLQP
jgi:hypothetical protein